MVRHHARILMRFYLNVRLRLAIRLPRMRISLASMGQRRSIIAARIEASASGTSFGQLAQTSAGVDNADMCHAAAHVNRQA